MPVRDFCVLVSSLCRAPFAAATRRAFRISRGGGRSCYERSSRSSAWIFLWDHRLGSRAGTPSDERVRLGMGLRFADSCTRSSERRCWYDHRQRYQVRGPPRAQRLGGIRRRAALVWVCACCTAPAEAHVCSQAPGGVAQRCLAARSPSAPRWHALRGRWGAQSFRRSSATSSPLQHCAPCCAAGGTALLRAASDALAAQVLLRRLRRCGACARAAAAPPHRPTPARAPPPSVFGLLA